MCLKYTLVKHITICIVFFTLLGTLAAQEPENTRKELYPALLGGLFTNTAFHLTSRLFGADFAQTSPESVKTNLTSAWVWDSDHFLFNHPGHPYQGGLYHASARASGFNFYESMFFDGIGSLTWELFGETDIPALNDLVVTTSGGAVFGEILHRLYLETGSVWAGIPVSPMDALTNAVLGQRPSKTGNLYYFSAMAGSSWIQSIKQEKQYGSETAVFTGNIGGEIVYGNPFAANSKIPYSQFEVKMQLGLSPRPLWLDWTILTDGFLVSFNPVYTAKDSLSTGLSMQYDLITGNNTNFASNALDWSVKWKRSFRNTHTELKAHTGWTFFGSSQYYPLAEITGEGLDTHDADNDYGTGVNLKLSFTIQTSKYGKITLGACSYLLYIIPWNKPESRGIESFNLSYFEYTYSFTKNISLFLSNSLYLKSGTSQRRINVVESANRIILGVQWMFLEKKAEKFTS